MLIRESGDVVDPRQVTKELRSQFPSLGPESLAFLNDALTRVLTQRGFLAPVMAAFQIEEDVFCRLKSLSGQQTSTLTDRTIILLDCSISLLLIEHPGAWRKLEGHSVCGLSDPFYIDEMKQEDLVHKYPNAFLGLPAALAKTITEYETTLNEYQEEFRTQLGTVPIESKPDLSGMFSAMANAMFNGAANLGSEDAASEFSVAILSFMGSMRMPFSSDRELVEGSKWYLQVLAARELCTKVESMCDRIIRIRLLVSAYTLSRRGMAFLLRVGRSYIYGFDPECVILCRSVLDSEFEAEISADDCITVLRKGRLPYFSLDDRIAAARTLGRIKPEIAQFAHEVREIGNRMVHRRPDGPVDVLEVIRKTLAVVRALTDE